MQREQLVLSHAEFLAEQGPSPRVLVLRRVAGMGTTSFVEQLHAELCVRGCFHLHVIDAPGRPSRTELRELHARLAGRSVERAVIVSDRPEEVELLLGSVADVRMLDLPPLADEDARSLLEQLGRDPWSMEAAQLLVHAAGVPGRLVEAAVDAAIDGRPVELVDESFHADAMPPVVATWTRARVTGDQEGAAAVLRQARRRRDADAVAARAEQDLVDARFAVVARLQRDDVRTSSIDGTLAEQWLLLLVRAAGALEGDPGSALQLHALAGAYERQHAPALSVRAWQLVALVARTRGDRSTARRAVQRGIRSADAAALLSAQLELRSELALLHLADRDPASAIRYASEVVDVAGDAGYLRIRDDAALLVTRARLRTDLGRAARSTPAASRVDAPGALTPREREVAQLVAARMTNGEIAAELRLSSRTVEHHVASILRKLDLASRRDLALRVV